MGFLKKLFDTEPVQMAFQDNDVPSYEDEQRALEERRKLLETEKNRKGRRSTILTGGTGLNDIEEENINQKTLLGG